MGMALLRNEGRLHPENEERSLISNAIEES
jgi:hypothetical protein